MFLLTTVGLAMGYLFPLANSPSLRQIAMVLFGYATLVTAMSTSFKHFLVVLKKPLIPLWILFLTHCVTPIIAWAVGMVAFPNDPLIRIGLLIAASVPIGVSSIIWTALCNGYVAISLVAVSLDTLIVPVVLPAFFRFIVGKSIHIDCLAMAKQLMLMVTLPSVIGMVWHDRSGSKILTFTRGVGGLTAKLAILAVMYINSAVAVAGIPWSFTVLKVSMVILGLVMAGYAVGYLSSLIISDKSRAMTLTLMFNIGLRNISVGLVLALTYFPPQVAIPITLYVLFQQPVAALIPILFKPKAVS